MVTEGLDPSIWLQNQSFVFNIFIYLFIIWLYSVFIVALGFFICSI